MIKLFIILIMILLCFLLYGSKEKKLNDRKDHSRILYYLHVIIGIAFTLVATIHALGNFRSAPLGMILTGGMVLLLLYIEIITGLFLKKRFNPKLRRIHKIILLIIVICIICHVLVLKII